MTQKSNTTLVIPTGAQRDNSQSFVILTGAQRSGETCCRVRFHNRLPLFAQITSRRAH
jgi:hypothetical protein